MLLLERYTNIHLGMPQQVNSDVYLWMTVYNLYWICTA